MTAETTMASGERRADACMAIDSRIRPQDSALDDRGFADVTPRPDDAVRAHPCAALHDGENVEWYSTTGGVRTGGGAPAPRRWRNGSSLG